MIQIILRSEIALTVTIDQAGQIVLTTLHLMFGSTRFRWNFKSIGFLNIALAVLGAGCSVGSLDNPPDPGANRSLASDGFTNFETEPVRPLALSADGRYLYALNTADDRLEIFDTKGDNLRSIGETAVGLRPVALALSGDEAWVVNHLSDSVSVVDVRDPTRPRVVRTLQVGDEPRGIVAAGTNRDRMFVATARQGRDFDARDWPCAVVGFRGAPAAGAGKGCDTIRHEAARAG